MGFLLRRLTQIALVGKCSDSKSVMDDEDIIFHEDDALNYILYEDAEKESDQSEKKGGCLELMLFLSSLLVS